MLFKLLKTLVLFLLLSSNIYSSHVSSIYFQFQIKNNTSATIHFKGFYGHETFEVDSFKTDQANSSFLLRNNQNYKGFYRLTFNDTTFYDLIAEPGDSIYISVDLYNFKSTFTIENSTDNSLLLEFKKTLQELNNTLNLLINIDSDNDIINSSSKSTILELKKRKNQLVDEYTLKFKHATFKTLIQSIKEPINTEGIEEASLFLFNLQLNDSTSIHTNTISQNLIDYLAFYRSTDELSFEKGIKEVFAACKNNEYTKQYCLFFYLNLFNKVGPDFIFKFLVENYYLGESCHDDSWNDNKDLIKSINNLVRLLPGNKINDITFQTINKKEINLYNITKKHDKTILVFWSPECHYCEELIVKLKKDYKKYKKDKTKFLFFAITKKEEDWKNKSSKFKWLNTSDLKGWDSEIVKSLSINKTPMLISLDSENIILKYDFYLD